MFNKKDNHTMPMLALRGLNIFPGMMLSFDVERSQSLAALNQAMSGNQEIFLVTQRDIAVDVPTQFDLFGYGVVCRIRQLVRQPNGKMCKVMVEGAYKAMIGNVFYETPYFFGEVVRVADSSYVDDQARADALIRTAINLFKDYIAAMGTLAPEMLLNVAASKDPEYVAYYIAQNSMLHYEDKQSLLEESDCLKRLIKLNDLLAHELDIISVEKEMHEATDEQMNQNQREYYLREMIKKIQQELGEEDGDEIEEFKAKIREMSLDKPVKEKLLKEVRSLAKQPFGSAEATVIRNYIETCLELPWGIKTEENFDIDNVKKALDADHFGLEKVKERVIEYLAVRKLAPDMKSNLLCLVGPPGTGKTSIAMSIARAINRNLVRISLGGVHDEAEIRGHRKTYIGAMPGRIINGIRQAKSVNPLMVLDEIDKLGSDYRGDPSAALLEALDPEQNGTFRDNFIELPFDLSDVFFITTANSTDTIPRALLDRMEVIELTSYTDEEKVSIAHNHLIPKQRKKHGLNGRQLKISDDAVREVISLYTRESGVRTLERNIAAICRKAAVSIGNGEKKSVSIRAGSLEAYLGAPKFKPEQVRVTDEIGLVRGLAWTSAGGEVLDVEVAVVDGTGKLELTGNLGDVMKESCHAAVTYIRSRADALGIDKEFYKTKDIHIHFPEAAVPKDGPSAGITICTAIISALTGRPVRHDIAMTGEISIRGRVLPIGGLKEKTMAAMRNGVTTVIVPADNETDLSEIDPRVFAALNFIVVDHMDKVIDAALVSVDVKNKKDIIIPVDSKPVGGEIRQ